MEVTSSAITGALRVGVQIVVARKRPVLEIYQEVRNEYEPPFEFDIKDHSSKQVLRTEKHRFQDISIDLVLVNIGGVRAENVTFEVTGAFRRGGLRDELPGLFSSVMRQFAPGQSTYLMRIDESDLHEYAPEGPNQPNSFKAVGIKKETMTIRIQYDGPSTLLNRLLRFPRKIRRMKQYITAFTFDPATVLGDLPPPKYNG